MDKEDSISAHTITDNWHCIEMEVDSINGTFELLVDGVSVNELTGLDIDTLRVNAAYLGAFYVPANTSGTIYFDNFASGRGDVIGRETDDGVLDPGVIFTDDFDISTGSDSDLGAWSGAVTDSGDLRTGPDAAAAGAYGLEAFIDDTTAIYVTDASPMNETHYRARFYVNPDDLTMADGNRFTLLLDPYWNVVVDLAYSSYDYYLIASTEDDSDTGYSTAGYRISEGWHAVEIEWSAATASGADDGSYSLWIDGTLVETISDLDNDAQTIDTVMFGAPYGLDSATGGYLSLDEFASGNEDIIGLDAEATLADPVVIFEDGFEESTESTNFPAWDGAVTDSGDLSTAVDTGMFGEYSMQAVIDDTTPIYVSDQSPYSDTHYRARFYVDPNSLVMGDGEQFTIFADNNEKFWVDLKYDSTAVSYYLIAGTEDDNSTATTTSEYAITDDWFAVEIEWQASSGAGMNDGFLELWIGGNLMQTLSGIDNDTVTINGVKLGAVGYLDTNTGGTIYFDQFKSTRGDTEIGLASPEETLLYDHGTGAASSLKTEVSLSAKYVYDGDGNMVMSIINGVITYYPGRHYQKEVSGETVTVKKYYTAAGMTIAVRTIQGTTDTLNWLLSDHLGSTSITANADGTLLAKVKYTAFGEVRESEGTTPTDYLYTGQLSQMAEIGLYFYVARFYDPSLAHFISADTVIPNAGSAISYDRYAYVSYNAINYSDPSGHLMCSDAHVVEGDCTDDVNSVGDWRFKSITFDSRYSEAQKDSMKTSLIDAGNALAKVMGGGMNASGAIQKEYSGLTFLRAGENSNECQALSANSITCGYKADIEGDKTLITHELGHVYSHRHGEEPYGRLNDTTIIDVYGEHVTGKNSSGVFERTVLGYKSAYPPDMQHGKNYSDWNIGDTAIHEDWADMFMNWVYGSFADDSAGKARDNWMTATITDMVNQ